MSPSVAVDEAGDFTIAWASGPANDVIHRFVIDGQRYLVTARCADGEDNDGDGQTDYPDDQGCESADDVTEDPDASACSDRLDNDGDGRASFPADQGCANAADDTEAPDPPQCSDRIDNDGDDTSNYPDDQGCEAADDVTEDPDAPACSDRLDNDGDGRENFPADQGCANATDDTEAPDPPQCADRLDNDGDGRVSYPADPGCASLADDAESPDPPDPPPPPPDPPPPPPPALTVDVSGDRCDPVSAPDVDVTINHAATGTLTVSRQDNIGAVGRCPRPQRRSTTTPSFTPTLTKPLTLTGGTHVVTARHRPNTHARPQIVRPRQVTFRVRLRAGRTRLSLGRIAKLRSGRHEFCVAATDASGQSARDCHRFWVHDTPKPKH